MEHQEVDLVIDLESSVMSGVSQIEKENAT